MDTTGPKVEKTTKIATSTALAKDLKPHIRNSIIKTLALPREERLEIVYMFVDHFDEYFDIANDVIVGVTSLRIFKIEGGKTEYQFIEKIKSVTHQKNGIFKWDKIVCNLKEGGIDTYGIYHSSVCAYLCKYIKQRIKL